MRCLGGGIKEFKKATKDDVEEDKDNKKVEENNS